VTGQDHVTETLRRQIISDRLSHAYLFVGTRGTGKTTCAKILSRAVNCLSPVDGNPCNKCASCVGIENGSILDVLELDAASNNGVDNVRALREEAIYSPAVARKRVYIIDEVHMMTTSAFNALLKILEEPPEHLLFILATTELHKVPATILSRCQRFSFKRISPADIGARLRTVAESEGLTLTEDAASKLAALADGSMRDALSLLDQCASRSVIDAEHILNTIGLAGHSEILNLAGAAAAGNTTSALGILDDLYSDGRDISSLLNELASLIRDTLVYKLSPDSPLQKGGFSSQELSALSAKFTPERLFSYLEIIRGAVFSLSRGAGVKLTAEMCLIRMCNEQLSDDAPALLSRIAKLEENSELGIRNAELKSESLIRREALDPYMPSPAQNGKVSNSHVGTTAPVVRSSDLSEVSTRSESSGDCGDEWSSILENLTSDMSIHSLLSDSANIQAELRDNTLFIRACDQFTISLIESKKFMDPLAEAAQQALGRRVLIHVELSEGSSSEVKTDKLDELVGNFGIVKYE
jgi:DNA polymerase-3 subunit gamma/tau